MVALGRLLFLWLLGQSVASLNRCSCICCQLGTLTSSLLNAALLGTGGYGSCGARLAKLSDLQSFCRFPRFRRRRVGYIITTGLVYHGVRYELSTVQWLLDGLAKNARQATLQRTIGAGLAGSHGKKRPLGSLVIAAQGGAGQSILLMQRKRRKLQRKPGTSGSPPALGTAAHRRTSPKAPTATPEKLLETRRKPSSCGSCARKRRSTTR